jgi:hypothetical protein
MAILVGSPETCSELAVLMIRDLQKFCRSFPLFARILLLLFDVSIPSTLSINVEPFDSISHIETFEHMQDS